MSSVAKMLNQDIKNKLKSSRKKSGDTTRRYTPAQQKAILKFIEKYGRGGRAAARRKYGISQTAIAWWMKKAGKKTTTTKAAQIDTAVVKALRVFHKALDKAFGKG